MPNATTRAVKAAYRARIASHHPDRNASPDAHEIAILLNEAWHVLRDPERRRLYDADLAFATSRNAQQSSESAADSTSQDSEPRRSATSEEPSWEPRGQTDASSERTPWTCSGCGRLVPRYVDQCRCGQTRPTRRPRSEGPVEEKRNRGEQWLRVATVAGMLVRAVWFFSPSSSRLNAPAATTATPAIPESFGLPQQPLVPSRVGGSESTRARASQYLATGPNAGTDLSSSTTALLDRCLQPAESAFQKYLMVNRDDSSQEYMRALAVKNEAVEQCFASSGKTGRYGKAGRYGEVAR